MLGIVAGLPTAGTMRAAVALVAAILCVAVIRAAAVAALDAWPIAGDEQRQKEGDAQREPTHAVLRT
jgi:hypothetical protein